MKTAQQSQMASRQRELRNKIGERLRAMYAHETDRKLPTHLQNLLIGLQQPTVGDEVRK
jgi:hypothetical protein